LPPGAAPCAAGTVTNVSPGLFEVLELVGKE
jgi:hypothetical protein